MERKSHLNKKKELLLQLLNIPAKRLAPSSANFLFASFWNAFTAWRHRPWWLTSLARRRFRSSSLFNKKKELLLQLLYIPAKRLAPSSANFLFASFWNAFTAWRHRPWWLTSLARRRFRSSSLFNKKKGVAFATP